MKKIGFLFSFIALTIVGLSFYSCQKGENNTIQDIQENRTLTNEQIELIGEKHNEYLKVILDNNHSAKDKFQGLLVQKQLLEEKFFFKKQNSKKTVLASKDIEPINTIQDNIQIIKNNLSDKNNFMYFQHVIDFLSKESNNKTVENISLFTDKVRYDMVKNKVNVRDYEVFLVFASVLKKSAEFWLPKKLGGLNNYAYYKGSFLLRKQMQSNSESEKWRDCLRDVLIEDGFAAGSGLILGSLFIGATGGVATPAVLIEIAIGSGVTSAWAYYRSSNC